MTGTAVYIYAFADQWTGRLVVRPGGLDRTVIAANKGSNCKYDT